MFARVQNGNTGKKWANQVNERISLNESFG